MRRLGKIALTLGALVLFALPASAQQGRRGGFGGPGGMFGRGGGMMLLMNKSVQEELKVDDDQAQKIDDLMAKNRETMQGLSPEERREKMASIQAETNKAVEGILKPEQVTRLHEIQNQVGGANAMLSERNAEKLKLTDDQKTKIQDVLASSREKMQGLFGQGGGGQGNFEEARKKIQDLQAETKKEAVAVLTDDQKKTWDELSGKPFEIKYEAPRPRNNN